MDSKRWLIGFVWRRREVLAEPSPGQVTLGAWQEMSRAIEIESAEFPEEDFLIAVIRRSDINIEPDQVITITAITELPGGWGQKAAKKEA